LIDMGAERFLLATALEESRLFTSMVVSMVKVGEESGELTQVLEQVATCYRDKVRKIAERITSGIEPIVILGMGVSVAEFFPRPSSLRPRAWKR
jgi:type II secretory pathway component PulF